ncbi:MAG: YcgL domain-containing protein [Glaciecola sp.]|jgi:uncharacterized protein YcgL (UPF0745 family)|nr:YcgL domain-containing protein [Glaciecola sp.]MDG1815115.1 YcgL domain-containing protein [Glaciecola sp.]MDG2098519.1 YcgL domain-containing protein [Glaciecola sp.]
MRQICAIYKSNLRPDTFIYVPKKEDFSAVPEGLLTRFGRPELVMLLPLPTDKTFANVDQEKLIKALVDPGYYLQLPPVCPSLLAEHRIALGLSPDPQQDT